MSVKLAILKSGETVISELKELEVSMSPWIILTKDTKIPIRPDWIVTIVEPLDSLIEMYEEKLNGKEHSMSSIEE